MFTDKIKDLCFVFTGCGISGIVPCVTHLCILNFIDLFLVSCFSFEAFLVGLLSIAKFFQIAGTNEKRITRNERRGTGLSTSVRRNKS